MTDKRFDGEGYDRTPFSDEELAELRHLQKTLEKQWGPIESAVMLVQTIKMLYGVIRVGGPVGLVLFGAGAWAKSQGML